MKPGVPKLVKVRVRSVGVSSDFASPKSLTSGSLCSSNKIFPGLRSRCSETEASCSRFGSALRQNHTGSSSSASAAADCVTYSDYGLGTIKFQKKGRIQIQSKHGSCERTIA